MIERPVLRLLPLLVLCPRTFSTSYSSDDMENTLSVREIGEGFPLLFIHGWASRSQVEELDFEPIFNKMPGLELRRIYVDLPGMGTTPANNVKDLDDIYNSLVQFVDSHLEKSRFLLAGSSCGGYLAHAMAQKYIEQVDGLLLRVPLLEPLDSKRDLDTFQPLVSNEQVLASMSTEDKALLGNVLVQTPAYVQALKARYEVVFIPAQEAAENAVLDPIRADPQRYSLSFWSDIEHAKFFAPALVVSGRHDDCVGYRDSRRLLELYPRSTYVVLDRGTHDLPVDEGGVFEALVRDWVFRVKEWQNRID